MELKEVLKMNDGVKGLEVTAVIMKVFEPKSHPEGKFGPWKSQMVIVRDIMDSKSQCIVSLKKGFLGDDAKGSVYVFTNCERDSYEKEDNEGVTKKYDKINCNGEAVVAKKEQKTTVDNPHNTSGGPTVKAVDWDKKELIIARESVLKSATAIVAAQIQAGTLQKDIDIMEYSCRMADFFENFIYNGYNKIAEAKEIKEEIDKSELDKRLAIIKHIQSAQTRYTMPLEEVMALACKVAKKQVETLQEVSCEGLEEMLKIIIDTKVLKKEPASVPVKEEDQPEIPF